jgi:hypothetical protein
MTWENLVEKDHTGKTKALQDGLDARVCLVEQTTDILWEQQFQQHRHDGSLI